jgi:hypothetical protein
MPTGSRVPVTRTVRRPIREAASYDEAPAPARTARRAAAPEPEEPTPARRGNFRAVRPAEEDGPDYSVIGKGAKFAQEQADNLPTDFAPRFDPPSGQDTLIKFIDPDGEPFAVYLQHWADWTAQGVKKSYVCLRTDCPLDRVNTPKHQECWNVVDLSDPERPKVCVWTVGIKVSKRLKTLAEESRTGPLNRDDMYFVVTKSGGKDANGKNLGPISYTVAPLKARDLNEDWGIDPFTDDELGELENQLWTVEKTVQPSSRSDIEAVAKSYRD